MPIYEYVCRSCGKRFDHLWTSITAAEKAAQSGENLPCPACQNTETGRIISQVAVLGELGGLTPGEQRGLNAQAERIASITPREQIKQLQANRQQKNSSS
ncbi:MAG: zinc ribbon domain-containing protein [Caldilineaceae bacterium]|nr:zinc ribbon domain-containing protein [Caldilineaceae bacterium]